MLLHGYLGSARNVGGLGRGLIARDKSLSVFALDLPGHGESPRLSGRADLGNLAAEVLDAVRALGVRERFMLCGHSLGGRVALQVGLREPAAVAHLTLLDITPSIFRSDDTERIVAAFVAAPAIGSREVFRAHFRRERLADAVTDWLLLNLVADGDTYRWRVDRAALAALRPRIGAEDLWEAVEGAGRSYSAHCIRGALSPYVSDADARRFETAGGRVDTVAGAGHFLHVDRPHEVVERILHGLATA